MTASNESTLSNVQTRRGETSSSNIRFTPDVFPEAKNTRTGVSVRYVPDATKEWFVFRASYRREDKASNFLIDDGTYTYIAKKYVEKHIHGKRQRFLATLIPNLVFAYTTKQKADEYVNSTPALSYLSYYYNHFENNAQQKNPPLTIPLEQMNQFVQATSNRNEHLLFVDESQCHYKGGEKVVVTEGTFKGVKGRVARIAGQQRVVVELSTIGLISTAYIPTAFIKTIE